MAAMMGQQPALDTPQTARQPQEADPDTQTFEAMVSGLRDHIFGKGEQGIVERLKEASGTNLVQALGEITFALVHEAAKQAEEAGRYLDMDILMGVATEVLDDLADLCNASGISVTDQNKQDALLVSSRLYSQTVDPSDENREAAKADLAEQKRSGEVDRAVEYIQKRGMEEGADPFGVEDGTMTSRPGMMGKKSEE